MIVLMNDILIYVALVMVGAACGSFAGAQLWRLRASQLVEDKEAGEKVNEKEYKRLLPLTKQKGLKDRSIDLDTGKQLAWYDLIPIVSWLALRGKSRYSGKPIGIFEFLREIGVAVFFVLTYVFWPSPLTSPIEIAKFVIWLIAGVILAIQFATDYKWQILWTWLSCALIALGFVYAALTIISAPDTWDAFVSVAGSVSILGGLYFILYLVSRERWVGLGDAILGLGLGLLLADWMLAFIALFMANLIGTIVVLVGFATRKIKRGQHVPFGPFFIAGTIIALLFGDMIIRWYFTILL